jgi:hypothetical protein
MFTRTDIPTAVLSGEYGVAANVTQDYIPIKDNGALADSPLRMEDGILKSSVSIQSPPASFKVGGNVTISDGGSVVGYSLGAQGSTYELAGSLYDENSGTVVGLAVSDYLQTGAVDLPTQSVDTDTQSFEQLIWQAQIFTKAQDPVFGVEEDIFRVYRVVVRGDVGPQAPVRVRLYIADPVQSPGLTPFFDNVDAREPEWLAGEFGFDLATTGESILEFKTAQRLRAGFPFFIEYSVPPGQQFTIKGDAIADIGFGPTFVPYQVSTVLPGYEEDVAPPRTREVLATSGNSWTTIITHAVSDNTTENVTFQAYGTEDGGGGLISAELIATVVNVAGVTVGIGETLNYRHRVAGTPDIRAQADGLGNLLLQVKGTGGDNWNWRGIIQTRTQRT